MGVRDNLLKDIVQYLDAGQRVNWYGARDSEGRLITIGERHLLATHPSASAEIRDEGALPESLRGIYASADSNKVVESRIETMMFEFRELRSIERSRGLSPGQKSEMQYMEGILKGARDVGDAMQQERVNLGIDHVPF